MEIYCGDYVISLSRPPFWAFYGRVAKIISHYICRIWNNTMGFQVFKNADYQDMVTTISFLFRKARGPDRKKWIPACAGMTEYYQGFVATISDFSWELSLSATALPVRSCPRPRRA